MQQVWCKQLISEKNISLAFVYTLNRQKNVTLKMAASNEYQIFCNGTFLAYGPMRSAHGFSHIRLYTLTPDSTGTIVVSVIVCGAQANSYDRINELPFFAAEIMDENKILATSMNFKAYRLTDRLQKVQRYSFQRTFTESYRLTEARTNLLLGLSTTLPTVEINEIHANALLTDCEISEPDYTYVSGEPFESGVVIKNKRRRVLHDRSLTGKNCPPGYVLFHETELEEILSAEAGQIVCYKNQYTDQIKVCRNGYIAYDLKRNLSGFFTFDIRVNQKATLYLLFDEIATSKTKEGLFVDINRLQCCNAIKYVFEKGNYSVVSFSPYTARYIRFAMPEGEIEIHNFGMITLENPDDTLQYSCSDIEIAKIVDAARSTFRQNAIDILTDCPSRERAGWLCDSFFSARAEKFLTGKNKVEKNFLHCLLLSPELPFAKGMLPMCYPSDHIDNIFIPNWSMWFIIELRDYLSRTNDLNLIARFKNKVYGIIAFLDRYINEYGLLENLPGWVFIEWSKANEFVQGVNFPSNMLYALALKCAYELYSDKTLLIRYERMKQAIQKLSYNGQFFVDQALRNNQNILQLTNNISETCQYYAFWTDIADKKTFHSLYTILLKDFSQRNSKKIFPHVYPANAFIGRLLRLDYFLREKKYNMVLEEAKKYYLPMAERTGTLWENLTTTASCNHGFSSYIAYILITAYSELN